MTDNSWRSSRFPSRCKYPGAGDWLSEAVPPCESCCKVTLGIGGSIGGTGETGDGGGNLPSLVCR